MEPRYGMFVKRQASGRCNNLLQDLPERTLQKESDRYFTKSSLNTQGIGLMLKKDFNSFWEMFGINRKKKKKNIEK